MNNGISFACNTFTYTLDSLNQHTNTDSFHNYLVDYLEEEQKNKNKKTYTNEHRPNKST